MRELRIIHSADLHLDSAFEGLGEAKAAQRRREQRQLLSALAELTERERADLVLLAGDLLDSDQAYRETGEELVRCLGQIPAPVFISPGNHDYYSPRSPYARLKLPGNVQVFTQPQIQGIELRELGAVVYGAAFLDKRSAPMLRGFTAPRAEGLWNLLCLHGELAGPGSAYAPIAPEELEASGMDYVALGHVHKASGLRQAGACYYAWPGCPEGRGFDELGDKTLYLVNLNDDGCTLEERSIAQRRYQRMEVDISGREALEAVAAALPEGTERDIYRIVLTGQTDRSPDLPALNRELEGRFFHLQLRDRTRPLQELWDRAGEDSLRGLFLAGLMRRYEQAGDEAGRRLIEQAARWGLAALDNGEEVLRHGDT